MGNQPKYDRTIAEIADELEPWQQPWRGHREQVLRVIKDEIELVREDLTDHARDAIEKNRDNARDIIKSIDKLEKQLKKARFLWWLSSPANPAIESLRRISVVCKNYTEPNRQNYAKLYCARTAVCLIRLISEKSPTNGSTNAPLRIIAQKFHTILGPQEGKASELRGACAQALKESREEGELYWEEHCRLAAAAYLAPKKSS